MRSLLSRGFLLRIGLALGSLVLVLAALEGALRARYSTLPSLAALEDGTLETERYIPPGWEDRPAPGADPNGCRDPVAFAGRRPAWTRSTEGSGETLHLWVLGDSLTMGHGVEPEEAFAALLAERIAATTGRPVRLSNLGLNGANYCEPLRELHNRLDKKAGPDLLLWNLFADDLQLRSVIYSQGSLLGYPQRIASPALRYLATHSYLVNLTWVTLRSRSGAPLDRFVDEEGQRRVKRAMEELRAHLAERHIPLVTTLHAPVGMPLCETLGSEAPEECRWMREDLALLDTLLSQVGIEALDLSGTWEDRPLHTLWHEMEDLDKRGRLPIHPNPAGHVLLADAMMPTVGRALEEIP